MIKICLHPRQTVKHTGHSEPDVSSKAGGKPAITCYHTNCNLASHKTLSQSYHVTKLSHFHSDLPDPLTTRLPPHNTSIMPHSPVVCVCSKDHGLVTRAAGACCSVLAVSSYSQLIYSHKPSLRQFPSLSPFLSLSLQRPQLHRSPNRELSPKYSSSHARRFVSSLCACAELFQLIIFRVQGLSSEW